jgi:uncharacterized protein YbaR (Trm112 family)
MRKELIESYFICPSCRKDDLTTIAFLEKQGDIIDGIITCRSCNNWYRLENGLLELLVPSLQDVKRKLAFQKRFESMWNCGTDREKMNVSSLSHQLMSTSGNRRTFLIETRFVTRRRCCAFLSGMRRRPSTCRSYDPSQPDATSCSK